MELEFLSRECPSILRADIHVKVLKGVLQLVCCDMFEVIKADFIPQNF